MKRVVQYIQKFSTSHWGGAEEGILHLAGALRAFGFASEVWTTTVFGGMDQERLPDVVVRRFPGWYLTKAERAGAGSGKAAFSHRLLWEILRGRGIDLLHVHGHNRMASLVIAAAKRRRIPVVLTLHSQFLHLSPRWRYWFQTEYGIGRASSLIAVNESILKSIASAGLARGRATVIPNGVDTRVFSAGDGGRFRQTIDIEDQPLVITVGRICQAKNQMTILRVFPLLEKKVPDIHWAVIGFPSDHAYYEQLVQGVRQLDLGSRIHVIPGLPPRSEQLLDAYKAADVFALTSSHEAYPLVVLESWAAGLPVVANDVVGIGNVISNGVNGLLVHPHDADALASAISLTLTDDSIRTDLSRNGLESARRQDWNHIAARLAAVYERTVAQAESR